MILKGLREFTLKNNFRWISFTKEDSYYSIKKKRKEYLVKLEPSQAKEYHELFLKNKDRKLANYKKPQKHWHKISYCWTFKNCF